MWGGTALWIDARSEEEFARGHVPGAIQFNEDNWDGLLREVLAAWTPERKLIVYCSRKPAMRATRWRSACGTKMA